MISKEYTVLHDKYDRKAIEIMRSWCNQYVGKAADSRDAVTAQRPWIMSRNNHATTFHFCKEEDAMTFAMRWL